MNAKPVEVRPIGWADMPAITRMTFNNMTGVDRYFTKMVRSSFGRWLAYGILPLYLGLSGRGFKALVDERIAGCGFVDVRQHSGYIFNVSVNEPYRRQGIGRRLMTYLEQTIVQYGPKWAVLQVDQGNVPAERLYRQMGYRAYHPHFMRREIRPPIGKVISNGVTTQRLAHRPGNQLYKHYQNMERQQGDFWAASIIDEYYSWSQGSDSYWLCRLFEQDIGCASVTDRRNRPLIRLALSPENWGHPATGGIVKELVDSLSGRPVFVDLSLESSTHHKTAVPILSDLGFQERCRPRWLMLKPLANG